MTTTQATGTTPSAFERLAADIREANLNYLLLARQMLVTDRAEALFRLGLSSEVAEILESLSNAQVLKLAAQGNLLAQFRFDDAMVWNLLASPKRDETVSGMHAAILMASHTATSV